MQIRQLKITNFRGIVSLDWKPADSFCCLIGAGDTGKSTILDAIEAALSSRWYSFMEPDFANCDTTGTIAIEVTVGELSKSLKSDERFGLYIRGWTSADDLRDEPEDGDEAVLTVRLTVDASMEPVWELVCDRVDDPRTLSNRDRALFGLVRLAGEDARHLTWGQGSVLSRLTDDSDEAAQRLAEAYGAARKSAQLDKIEALANAAQKAESFAKSLGAYIQGNYKPGLELGRAGLSTGSIALHDDNVPLRLTGLGSRRLATLAIQRSAIAEGAIVLVDEIEHGLEPHRIMGAISQLKGDQLKAQADGRPIGQVLMTTHSDVALAEAGTKALRVVQPPAAGRVMSVSHPSDPDIINPLLRFSPRAFFARRVLVVEGNTELGMLTGVRQHWPSRHSGIPIEHLGSAICDGNGSQAPSIALSLQTLGYKVAIFRDSDQPIRADVLEALTAASVPVFEYGHGLNTEQAIFSAATDEVVQALLVYARAERGDDAIDNNLQTRIGDLDIGTIRGDFEFWELMSGLDGAQLRSAIAEVAAGKKWFKDQRIGRGLAPLVWRIATEDPASPISQALSQTEAWMYG